MLTAKNKQGDLVQLVHCSDEEMEMHREQQFFCPVCGQEVQLKAGHIRIPHFAHRSLCSFAGSVDNESEEHLALKEMFIDWCESYKISYQVEAYLPDLKQRPDLLIGNIAIEVQCSSLGLGKIMKRTRTYLANGYIPLWICGEHFWHKQEMGENIKAFTLFSKTLGFYFWAANWRQKTLMLYYHLEENLKGQVYYGRKVWPFCSIPLNQLFHNQHELKLHHTRSYDLKTELLNSYRYLAKKLLIKDKKVLSFQECCYKNHQHLLQLHPWFYYEVSQRFVYTHSSFYLLCSLWQFLKEQQGERIQFEVISQFCQQLIIREKLLYTFPAISADCIACWLINQLVESLIVFRILARRAGETFVIKLPDDQFASLNQSNPFKSLDFPQAIITSTPLKI
ncbi:competence protein CoiA [Enterococcus sp. LJL128]